ncbi:MAG TPA: DUF885 domain-containing protein [Gemmatimonadaceae bacterium]|nr:DUF885 domain-containing protein [Gemmatimonadaceae bacterium]
MTGKLLLAITLLGAAAAVPQAQTADTVPESLYARVAGQSGSDSARFHVLLDAHWRFVMREFPTYATDLGWPGRNDRWADGSETALERRRAAQRQLLRAVESVSRDGLGTQDRVSYDLFRRGLEEEVEGYRFPSELMPVTQRGGPHSTITEVLSRAPARTVADYEDILQRMRRSPQVVEDDIAWMQKGLARGITPPRVTLRDLPTQVRNLIVDDPLTSPAFRTFNNFPAAVSEAERTRLRAAAVDAYTAQMRPALERLASFLADTYVPNAREALARSTLPDGEAWYAHNVRSFTTTAMTAAQIHQLGLSEVARIRVEMDSIIRTTGFQGDFPAFVNFLRTDPRFYHTDSASLVQEYRDISKRIDPGLVRLFGRLPRLPYGVTTIPSYMAPSQTTAYYMRGSAEARRPGYYYVNTYDLKSRPKWEMEALSLHEAVPGHHLQIALAQELEGLPRFRQFGDHTVFVEGWALYAESLGPDLEMYKDPYSKFGQLTYEIWRAIRLVLDTGIHSMGWTREQAIEYFAANSAKTELDIAQEVDRYIVWPGQALAYKIGELKIKELRRETERTLGARFDVRAFHDEVLRHGALPLDVLERNVREWIAVQPRG